MVKCTYMYLCDYSGGGNVFWNSSIVLCLWELWTDVILVLQACVCVCACVGVCVWVCGCVWVSVWGGDKTHS